ncbi:hypothetical protein BJX99DRAFT_252745 [Aspergillus californicus]
MASAAVRQPLTERNLAIHEQKIQSQIHATEPVSLWVEQVIAEEQTHLYCAQQNASTFGNPVPASKASIERGMNLLDQGKMVSSTAPTTDVEGCKQQRPFMFLASPLDRFLTPGSSDPSYFSRPALAHMGIRYGGMEGAKERSDIARGHVEMIKERARCARDTSSK